MARHALQRLYKAVTRAEQRRDEIEMESINRLLSPLVPARAPATSATAIRLTTRTGFRSILCPVDFSDHSRLALRYAAALARRSHGRLSILYVNDPLLITAAGIALNDPALARRNLAELRRFVASTVSPHATERAQLDEFVTSGRPIDEITKAAKRRRCDLIVMGTHGLTGADRLLFIGSTTHGVLQRTSVPVLAIPGGRAGIPAPGPSWPGRRIIVAVELDRRAMRDARAAVTVARSLGSAVLLVHVVPEHKSPLWLRKRMGASERTRIAQAQSRLEALAAGLRRQGEIETRVLFGDATRELAKLAATQRGGLVIMTLKTPRDWFGPRRGSMSYEVLSQVTAPLLALPG
jgi:nucleotide-binding universal stress UspA family protein